MAHVVAPLHLSCMQMLLVVGEAWTHAFAKEQDPAIEPVCRIGNFVDNPYHGNSATPLSRPPCHGKEQNLLPSLSAALKNLSTTKVATVHLLVETVRREGTFISKPAERKANVIARRYMGPTVGYSTSHSLVSKYFSLKSGQTVYIRALRRGASAHRICHFDSLFYILLRQLVCDLVGHIV